MNAYWEFLSRPTSASSTTRGIDVLPFFTRDVVILTVFFSSIYLLTNVLLTTLVPNWYKSLEQRKRSELPSYVLCLVHHFVAVPTAWYRVTTDWYHPPTVEIDYAPMNATIAPWCVAYLITDTIFYALPEVMRGKFDYIMHHVLVLSLVISSLFGPGSLLRYIPLLLISDTTNIFFNLAWLLRLIGMRGSLIVLVLELLFALSFLTVRVINMPAMFLALSQTSEIKLLGPARFVLAPVAMMQWFWFYKIVSTIFNRTTTKETKKTEKTVDVTEEIQLLKKKIKKLEKEQRKEDKKLV